VVGRNAPSTAAYVLSGGTINTGDLRVENGTGTMTQAGGLANLRYWSDGRKHRQRRYLQP